MTDPAASGQRRTGMGMLVIAWLVLLGIAAIGYDGWLAKLYNPNAKVAGHISEQGQRIVTLQANRQHQYVSSGSILDEPVVFILDTGAGAVVFHGDYFLESLQPPEDEGENRKIEKPTPFTVDSILLGGRKYEKIFSIALDLSELYKFAKVYYPGILGNPLFQSSKLHFNFSASTLIIEEV